MKLQQNSLLALYSLVEFAGDPTRHISAAEIAGKYQVSPHHLAKVLAELARAACPRPHRARPLLNRSARRPRNGLRFTGNRESGYSCNSIPLFFNSGQ
jgi:hypothetical protein